MRGLIESLPLNRTLRCFPCAHDCSRTPILNSELLEQNRLKIDFLTVSQIEKLTTYSRSTLRNELEGVFGSWFRARTPLGYFLKVRSNEAGSASNHSGFHCHKIFVKLKIVNSGLRIGGRYFMNHFYLIQICNQRLGLHSEGSLEKLRFGRYGAHGLEEELEPSWLAPKSWWSNG